MGRARPAGFFRASGRRHRRQRFHEADLREPERPEQRPELTLRGGPRTGAQRAMELLIDKLRKAPGNSEFLANMSSL